MRWLFWPMIALTAAYFVGMAGWTTLAISAEADWQLLFDARLAGYSFEAAQRFLGILSEVGLARYLGFARLLDTVFPALLAVSLIWGVCRFYGWRAALGISLVAVLAALLDWRENAAIAEMLRAGPDGIDEALVARASLLSIFKWICYGVALLGFAWGAVSELRKR